MFHFPDILFSFVNVYWQCTAKIRLFCNIYNNVGRKPRLSTIK